MPEYNTISEQVEYLKAWSSQHAGQVAAFELPELTIDNGERHGSWFLRLLWRDQGLSRSAELALTNSDITPDESTEYALITVRSTASNDERFVIENLYDKRRSLRRISSEQLDDWLMSALERARAYTQASLSHAYPTGIELHASTQLPNDF